MSGCSAASAARDKILAQCEPLAYGLHLVPWFKCRRLGGRSICGTCAGDVRNEERGESHKPDHGE